MTSKTQEILNELAEEMKNKKISKEIICPYCSAEQDEETKYPHVTYWGYNWSTCDDCGKDFYVKEHVTREFETTEWIEKENSNFKKLNIEEAN